MKHDIIPTKNYLLIVDDSEIKEGDWYLSIDQSIRKADCAWDNIYGPCPHKKIISHLPLNNSPILEDVDLLPPLEDEVILCFGKKSNKK